jgi:hypothetical protein
MWLFLFGFCAGAVAILVALVLLARWLVRARVRVDGEASTEPVKEHVVAIIGQGDKRHVVTN